MDELILKDEVYAVVGAAMEVHTVLGSGFLEPVYQEALGLELFDRGIPAKPKEELKIKYKELTLKKECEADFIVYGQVIVEIKALDKLTSREDAQLLNYLKATGFPVGVLINFGSRGRLEWKRMVRTER